MLNSFMGAIKPDRSLHLLTNQGVLLLRKIKKEGKMGGMKWGKDEWNELK